MLKFKCIWKHLLLSCKILHIKSHRFKITMTIVPRFSPQSKIALINYLYLSLNELRGFFFNLARNKKLASQPICGTRNKLNKNSKASWSRHSSCIGCRHIVYWTEMTFSWRLLRYWALTGCWSASGPRLRATHSVVSVYKRSIFT